MADIKDSVDGPGSQVQDIAMIQMMLKVVKDAKGEPYLKVNYSGEWNAETKDAIARFQQDQKLIPPEQPLKGAPDAKLPVTPDAKVTVSPAAAKLPAAAPAALKATEKAGVVELKSATFQKLNAMLPPEYKDALILPGSKTVYFPGTDAAAKAAATHISAHPQLDRVFASKAASFINEFYRQTKIVLKASATGLRRDFAGQMTVTSHAGPGESNHQFGKAADIGF